MKRVWGKVDVFVVFYLLFTRISRFTKQFLDKTDDDFDGDGYSEMGGDCDDNNVLFSPEAANNIFTSM